MASQTESKLLALPPEVVEHIIPFVTDQALLPLRLTCKTLHDLSFGYFTEVYFEELGCCISQIGRFLRLKFIINGPARITSKISTIHFTSDILERKHPLSVPCVARKLQSPEQSTDEAIDVLYENTFEGFDTMFVKSVLFDIKRLAAHIDICVHLDDPNPRPPKLREFHLDIALYSFPFCLATTDTKADAFALNPWNLQHMSYVLKYYRESFLSLMQSVEVIKWYGEVLVSSNAMEPASDILKATKNLEMADLTIGDIISSEAGRPFEAKLGVLPPQLLLACGFSKLTTLKLLVAMLSDADLLEALDRCKSTLEEIQIRFVALEPSNGGWNSIIQKLLTIPTLEDMGLRYLAHFEESGDDPPQIFQLSFVAADDRKWDRVSRSGVENVKSALRTIADKGFRDRDMSGGSKMSKLILGT